MNVVLIPFVERTDLTDQCINLMNQEWPRSETSRKITLERVTNYDPPMAFVLLESDSKDLIGFARFLHILNYAGKAALFETVVIKKELRGKGLGKILMDLLKEEAKKRKYDLVKCWICINFNSISFQLILCTEDKQIFYEKCGYKRCKFLNLITTLTAQSGRLAETMRFDRPIPIESETKASEITQSFNISSAPLPPPMLVNTNSGYKKEEYMFCYVWSCSSTSFSFTAGINNTDWFRWYRKVRFFAIYWLDFNSSLVFPLSQ